MEIGNKSDRGTHEIEESYERKVLKCSIIVIIMLIVLTTVIITKTEFIHNILLRVIAITNGYKLSTEEILGDTYYKLDKNNSTLLIKFNSNRELKDIDSILININNNFSELVTTSRKYSLHKKYKYKTYIEKDYKLLSINKIMNNSRVEFKSNKRLDEIELIELVTVKESDKYKGVYIGETETIDNYLGDKEDTNKIIWIDTNKVDIKQYDYKYDIVKLKDNGLIVSITSEKSIDILMKLIFIKKLGK